LQHIAAHGWRYAPRYDRIRSHGKVGARGLAGEM
jgi:hypothetical protein